MNLTEQISEQSRELVARPAPGPKEWPAVSSQSSLSVLFAASTTSVYIQRRYGSLYSCSTADLVISAYCSRQKHSNFHGLNKKANNRFSFWVTVRICQSDKRTNVSQVRPSNSYVEFADILHFEQNLCTQKVHLHYYGTSLNRDNWTARLALIRSNQTNVISSAVPHFRHETW